MKNLYLIGGTMGVGKTSVCNALKQNLTNAVFLDGDWCWNSDPFQVNDETKTMVIKNICFLLNQFIHCSSFDNIIFCWVMHQQSIIDSIIDGLDIQNCITKTVSLTCSSNTLKSRLSNDIIKGTRSNDILERSVARLPLYEKLNTIRIDTDDKTIDDVAAWIQNL